MRGLDLELRKVPIDVLRPYLDTLPVAGRSPATSRPAGFSTRCASMATWPTPTRSSPASRLAPGVRWRDAFRRRARAPCSSVLSSTTPPSRWRRCTSWCPSVILPGQLHLVGRLDGPWHDAQFVGTAEHDAPNGAVSRLVGAVRLDTRGPVLGVDLNADFDQLSFDALRSGYPDLTPRGALTGHVVTSGRLDSLAIHANVSGEIGTINAAGRIAVNTPHFAADSAGAHRAAPRRSARFSGHGNATSLNGKRDGDRRDRFGGAAARRARCRPRPFADRWRDGGPGVRRRACGTRHHHGRHRFGELAGGPDRRARHAGLEPARLGNARR